MSIMDVPRLKDQPSTFRNRCCANSINVIRNKVLQRYNCCILESHSAVKCHQQALGVKYLPQGSNA